MYKSQSEKNHDSAQVVPFDTERDRMEREEFARRVKQNREGNYDDVAKGR